MNYTISNPLTFDARVQYFKTSSFIQDVISNAKNGVFIDARLGYKF
jgi:hypothetical protein